MNQSTEDKLSDLVVDLNLKYDKVFSVIDIDYADLKKWENITPFYKNVNNEGIVLWKVTWLIYQGVLDKSISKLIDTAYCFREKADYQDFIIISKN